MKEKHKKYLLENNIKSLVELNSHIEGLKISAACRQMMFDLVYYMVNEPDDLKTFFAENNIKKVSAAGTYGTQELNKLHLLDEVGCFPFKNALTMPTYGWKTTEQIKNTPFFLDEVVNGIQDKESTFNSLRYKVNPSKKVDETEYLLSSNTNKERLLGDIKSEVVYDRTNQLLRINNDSQRSIYINKKELKVGESVIINSKGEFTTPKDLDKQSTLSAYSVYPFNSEYIKVIPYEKGFEVREDIETNYWKNITVKPQQTPNGCLEMGKITPEKWQKNTTRDELEKKIIADWEKAAVDTCKRNTIKKLTLMSDTLNLDETGGTLHLSKKCDGVDKMYDFKLPISGSINETGVKHNQDKLPLDTVISSQFRNALQAVALASFYGHHKYKNTDKTWDNFKRVVGGSQNYADAGLRHNMYKDLDDVDSGLPHIFLKAWNALAELEIWMTENKIDIEDFSKKYIKNLV